VQNRIIGKDWRIIASGLKLSKDFTNISMAHYTYSRSHTKSAHAVHMAHPV